MASRDRADRGEDGGCVLPAQAAHLPGETALDPPDGGPAGFDQQLAVAVAADAESQEMPTSAFPGLLAHLREDQGRALRAAAGHDLEADASQAARAEGRAHAAAASARSRAGQMAGKRGARVLRLLRRARQQQGRQGIPDPGDLALAPGAAAPQPADPPELGTHEPPRHPVAAPGPDHTGSRIHGRACDSTPAPEAGAQCGNSARWDLSGGAARRAVPTATVRS